MNNKGGQHNMYELKQNIREEKDLYGLFDPDSQFLSEDVVSYIARRYQEKDSADPCCIHIISELPASFGEVSQ